MILNSRQTVVVMIPMTATEYIRMAGTLSYRMKVIGDPSCGGMPSVKKGYLMIKC